MQSEPCSGWSHMPLRPGLLLQDSSVVAVACHSEPVYAIRALQWLVPHTTQFGFAPAGSLSGSCHMPLRPGLLLQDSSVVAAACHSEPVYAIRALQWLVPHTTQFGFAPAGSLSGSCHMPLRSVFSCKTAQW
jgi:hypothetical protein